LSTFREARRTKKDKKRKNTPEGRVEEVAIHSYGGQKGKRKRGTPNHRASPPPVPGKQKKKSTPAPPRTIPT